MHCRTTNEGRLRIGRDVPIPADRPGRSYVDDLIQFPMQPGDGPDGALSRRHMPSDMDLAFVVEVLKFSRLCVQNATDLLIFFRGSRWPHPTVPTSSSQFSGPFLLVFWSSLGNLRTNCRRDSLAEMT